MTIISLAVLAPIRDLKTLSSYLEIIALMAALAKELAEKFSNQSSIKFVEALIIFSMFSRSFLANLLFFLSKEDFKMDHFLANDLIDLFKLTITKPPW